MRTLLIIAVATMAFGCSVINSMKDYEIEDFGYDNLEWQEEPSDDTFDWSGAADHCAALNEDSHSDWRLPSIGELRSLIRGEDETELGGDCEVDDSCTESDCDSSDCAGSAGEQGPGDDGCYWDDDLEGDCTWYWSSTEVDDADDEAWVVYFYAGGIDSEDKDDNYAVRCVRDDD